MLGVLGKPWNANSVVSLMIKRRKHVNLMINNYKLMESCNNKIVMSVIVDFLKRNKHPCVDLLFC